MSEHSVDREAPRAISASRALVATPEMNASIEKLASPVEAGAAS